ncbi:hypothetical protein ACU4GR_04965 [Methylobacterium oryzae CBMB20]
MNLQAVAVERAAGRPMMSGFHGLYSLGCILGALLASGLLAAGLGAGWSVLLLVAGIAALFAAAWPGILRTDRAVAAAAPPSRCPAAQCWCWACSASWCS